MIRGSEVIKKLLDVGIYPSLSTELKNRVRLTNQIIYLICLAAFPFYIIFNLSGNALLGNMVIPIILSWLGCLYLNMKRYYDWAQFLVIALSCIFILFYTSALGVTIGIQLICFALFTMAMVLGDSERKYFKLFLLVIPVITFCLSSLDVLHLLSYKSVPSVYLSLSFLYLALIIFAIMYLSILYHNEHHARNLKKVNAELKEALYKAKKQKNILEKVSQQAAFTTLSMGIAHEIRNPMFNLLARAEIIEEDPGNAKEVLKFSEMIKRNISRILNITNTMLKYGNPVVAEKGKISIKSIINEIVDVTKGKCHQKNIRLVLNMEDIQPVVADSNRIYKAIFNIVMNAIESMESQGGTLTITVNPCDFENAENKWVAGVHISVSDTGIGVSADIRDTIFDPFFTTKYKNSGLGLAVALKSIHSHSGIITLDSKVGEGTTFNIYLPFGEE